MKTGPWKRSEDEGENIVIAIKHPLRRRLLEAFGDQARSPAELHRRLYAELSVISYHVRALAFYGLIDLVDDRPARGSVEHFYRVNAVGRRAMALAEAAGMDEAAGDS
jgi:hypothetical protein